jgi:phosphatidylserine decarboxylase
MTRKRKTMQHHYVVRETGEARLEHFLGDSLLKWVCPREREDATLLFRALTSPRASSILGFINFDMPLASLLTGSRKFISSLGIDARECLDPPEVLNTPRKVFERKIRYWENRPMPEDESIVVCPADARVLVGSLSESSHLFLKEKFFTFTELLADRPEWTTAFRDADFAIFRLTPDKYHYNHCPVSGRVLDFYGIEGACYPCNPGVVVSLASPYSKNRRIVTVIDTDVPEGSQVGLVAMVEIVALMVGDIVQAYSAEKYDDPQMIFKGMPLKRGQPKSLFRPGSSTVVLLFQKDTVQFDRDIQENLNRDLASRYSLGFGRSLVETEVKVRSGIAKKRSIP